MTRGLHAGLVIAFVVFGLGALGCADDLYGECQLPDDDEWAGCQQPDETQEVSCVTDLTECETGACGMYRDEGPFCTMRCNSDDDCASGECVEFVFQSGQNYCVQIEHLEK